MIDLHKLTIKSAHKHLTHGDFTIEELCDAYLNVIKEKNPDINAYIEVFDDLKDTARHAQKVLNEGGGVLTGIPIGVKDNILIKGKKAAAASKILENYEATYDATAIAKLKKAGALFIGRTNMDEFAMGSSTETSAFGITKNPYDTSRVPGGSSGGSAAAIAMDGALASLGTDTAGSVRQPAAFCGLVGLKPTYGAVSRSGLIALGSSLDQLGTMTKTVEDAEILFNAVRGHDLLDGTTVPDHVYADARASSANESLSMTIGVPRKLLEMDGIDDDVRQNFFDSVDKLKSIGYKIVDIDLPYVEYSLPVYYIILPGEASSNFARFDGVKYGLHVDGKDLLEDYMKTRGEGFGPEVRRRMLLGTYVLSAGYADKYYNKAQSVRKLISKDFENAFKKVQAIVMPTTPTPAFKLGEKTQDPVSMYLADVFTVPSNIVNVPTISVPSGMVEREGKQLPLGFQIIAPIYREDILFKIGKDFSGEV